MLHRLKWNVVAFELASDQVGDDLGIGLALEDEALVFKLAPQGRMVFDHSVMHDRHGRSPTPAAHMRMGIAIRRRPVRGPSGMADPAVAGKRLLLEHLFQRPDPAGTLANG